MLVSGRFEEAVFYFVKYATKGSGTEEGAEIVDYTSQLQVNGF